VIDRVMTGKKHLGAADAHRVYTCLACLRETRICRSCDRGNAYCSAACREDGRRRRLRQIRLDYQRTPRGAALHRLRQSNRSAPAEPR
jgi:hypothetical protein